MSDRFREWEKVLSDRDELKRFYSYLQSRKRTSAVDFWIDVEAYRRLPRQQRKEHASAIHERFLEEGAPSALTTTAYADLVPAALKDCEENSDGRLRTSLFDDAQQHALHCIVDSDLHRYHTSKSKPTGTAWKRTEQTLAIENYLRNRSKRREGSERSEEPDQKTRGAKERDTRKRTTRVTRKRSNPSKDPSASDVSEKRDTSTERKDASPKKSLSEPRDSGNDKDRPLAEAKRTRSKDIATAPDSKSRTDEESSPRRRRSSGDAPSSSDVRHASPTRVFSSRDGAADEAAYEGVPEWLSAFAANDVSCCKLNARKKKIGLISSLFESVVDAISNNSVAESVDLSHNELQDKHIGPLLAALQGNVTLQAIDIANNRITDGGVEHVIRWLESQSAAGGSTLSYISVYSESVSPAAEARLWKALNPPKVRDQDKEPLGRPRFGHKKSRSVDVGATTLPIRALLSKKARAQLGDVLQLLESALTIVSKLPDDLALRMSQDSEIVCPPEVVAALDTYDAESTVQGAAYRPPTSIEFLQMITSTRASCLLDGLQGELSWLGIPDENATSSEQYMHEKTTKQLEDMEELTYFPFVSNYLFHFISNKTLLFFTGTHGTSLEEVIRARLSSQEPIAEDANWIYNVVTITEGITCGVHFMRSRDVMISLPTRDTVHVMFEVGGKRASKAVLSGVHTVASRLHNMATADLRFIAPELLKDIPAKNVSKADVFSIGVILWELLTLQVLRLQLRSKDSPTPARRLKAMKKLNSDGTSSDAESTEALHIPEDIDSTVSNTFGALQVLAHQCTDPDPGNRPTLREVQEKLKTSSDSIRDFCGTPRSGLSALLHQE